MLRPTQVRGSYEALRDRALEVIEIVETLGVRVPKHGRLREYAKQLAAFCESGALGASSRKIELEIVHRAILEVSEWSLIVEQLAREPITPGFREVLRPAMSGGKTLADEQNQSSARDFQFEMLVAALLKRAGYEVRFGEPDVVVATELGTVGVAAKRPRSQGNLRRLFEDADDQIRRSGHNGIIAVDISYLLLPNNAHIPATDGGFNVIRTAIDAFAADTWEDAREFVNPARTIGYMVYGALVAARHGVPKRSIRGCLFAALPFLPGAKHRSPQLSVARGCSFGNFIPFSDDRMPMLRQLRERVRCTV